MACIVFALNEKKVEWEVVLCWHASGMEKSHGDGSRQREEAIAEFGLSGQQACWVDVGLGFCLAEC